MRIYHLTIPLSIAFAGLGVYMAWSVKPAAPPANVPVHPVSPQMAARASEKSARVAPEFRLPDGTGAKHSLNEFLDKPTLVYFIKQGCPCSIEAEPVIQELYKHLNKMANFVGIIGSPVDIAAAWTKDHQPPYPVLSDPSFATMKAYDAPNSVYSTLIGKDGKIIKQWAGWSERMLLEANSLIAQAAEKPEEPFDAQYAPKQDSSGCSFYTK
ncbi:MAG: redoxin domain-containing protein [Fimbriimonadaceae bacterium]